MLPSHLSTSTPASNISKADFENGNDGSSSELNVSMDDILRNSPAAALLGLKPAADEDSTDENADSVSTPEQSEEEVPEENSDDADNDSGEEADEESGEEEGKEDDQESTDEANLPSEEDIDWDYKIPVTVDGKTEYKTLAEVRKGFATDQHLSQKGRELGESKKQLDQERQEKLQDLVTIGSVLHEDMTEQETSLAKEYAGLKDKIAKAKSDGDRLAAQELKEQQEEIQEKYWSIRNKREDRVKKVVEKIQAQQQEQQEKLLKQFNEDIKVAVPDFNEKLAKSIREFALKEGLPEALLNSVFDANVVRVLNEYRKLKAATSKGSVKRKAVPTKQTPAKKGTPVKAKETRERNQQRAKVLQGQGSQADELDFLKRISTISRKL